MLLGGICMNIFTIDSLIKQAEEAHNEKDYVKEKNAYQELSMN